MKKFLIMLCTFFLLGTEIAWAQRQYPVFSASLGGGGWGGYYARRGVRRSVYRPYGAGTARNFVASKPAKRAREKIVLKYDPNQIELAEDQMEKLMPSIRRIQDGKVKSVELIGICRDYTVVSNRLRTLARVLRSYAPSMNVKYRDITGPAVIDANDHTVEFVEYW